MTTVEKSETPTVVDTPVLTITPSAAERLSRLLAERNIPNHALRVFVAGGGCSGMQYGMAFVEDPQEWDTVLESHGVRLVVDPTSAMYLEGSTIDFVDSLMGGGFRINNPQAVATCGCGHSFRTSQDTSAGTSDAAGCGSAACG
jgi:iron-sulfur cluster assembly accessory protein